MRLARENDAKRVRLIRDTFMDALRAARAIQKAQSSQEEVTDLQRGAFLRSTEELLTLERTYGRDHMLEVVGPSYAIASRKLQDMLR